MGMSLIHTDRSHDPGLSFCGPLIKVILSRYRHVRLSHTSFCFDMQATDQQKLACHVSKEMLAIASSKYSNYSTKERYERGDIAVLTST